MNLIELLRGVNGSSFIGLTTVTDVKLNKTLGGRGTGPNPHFGRVVKVTEGASVMVFQNKNINGYEAMVKRRLEQEGKAATDFQLGPRAWGTRLENLPVVEHNGKYYLEVIFLKAGRSHYLLNGKPVAKDDIIGMPADRDAGEQGGLENKVIIRTYAFDNIQSITINGDTHSFF